MNRPLEMSFWTRFKQLLKGIFLYNTIYWHRASDDLEIRHMPREERASLRPKRNLEIIRPREHPRPPAEAGAVLSLPPDYGERSDPAPVAPEPVRVVPDAADAGGDEVVEIHRRKKRRRSRHSQVMPKRYYDPSERGGNRILGWLFRK